MSGRSDSAKPLACLLMVVCLCGAPARNSIADDAVDYSEEYGEYDAILALDESQFLQLAEGWHGGFTVDNAVADDDGAAAFGADARYLSDGSELWSRLRVIDRNIYMADLQYSYPFYSAADTRWLAVIGAGYANDALLDRDFSVDLEDRDTDAAVGVMVEHEFTRAYVSSQLEAGWRRIERYGESVMLDEPVTLDVEKDFRALAWNVAAQWRLDSFEQSLWLRAAHVTDMDASACLNEICLATDALEETFTLYEATFDQIWYLTAKQYDGASLATRLSGYTASVDHVPYEYQFGLGGMYSVRGYDEGIVSGDEMALWRNELRLPWQSSSRWLAGTRQHVYAFYDWGMVWQHAIDIVINDSAFELLPEDAIRLCSAGIGIDLAVVSDISLRVEYAVVQAAIPGLVDRGDGRLHASIDWRAF